MARRVTNSAGDWNYPQQQQQHPPRPEVHQQYGQQYNAPPSHMNAPNKAAADPWNWGWEDANGGGESSNNNSQKDPTWDWSVETVSGGYQEPVVSNNATNYIQSSNAHQMWPGGYHQQFPPAYTPQVTSTHDVISDSFNSLSVVNQHPYSHVQQTVFNPAEERNETRQQNAHREQQDLFYNNNHKSGAQNEFHKTNANQTQSYFSGFHPPECVLGLQQNPNEGLAHLVEESRIHDKNSSVPFNTGSGFRENTRNEDVDVLRDVQNKSIPQVATVPDSSHRGELSSEALSSQWSTESLPSQGSDEISQATDNSNRQSEASNATGDVSTSLNCFASGSVYESFETGFKSDQEHTQTCVTRDSKHYASVEHDGLSTHSSHSSDMRGSEQLSDPSVSFFSTSVQSFSQHSSSPAGSTLQAPGIKPLDNSATVTNTVLSVVEKVSTSLESLTLNSSHPDVENVEVAPPENSNVCIPLVSAAAPLPPPPVSSPPMSMNRNTEKSTNPYAAKGASLNHKYANKNISRARGLAPSPHLSNEPDIDTKNSCKSTPPNSKINKVSSDIEISPVGPPKTQASPSAGLGFNNTTSQGRVPLSHPAEESVNLETVPDNKERPDVDVQLDRKSASPASSSRFHQAPVGQDATVTHSPIWPQESVLPDNQEVYLDTPPVYSRDQSSHDSFPLDSETGSRSNSWHRTPVTNASDALRSTIHSELDRVVPGQGEENPLLSNSLMQPSFTGPTPDISIEGIAKRQVPGHMDLVSSGSQSGVSNTVEDISARAVPGGSMAGDVMSSALTGSVSSIYLHRTVPGQTGGHQSVVTSGTESQATQGDDDTPPPGLSRMVPGESRGPEGQGGDEAAAESALDEPRVVTGLAEEGRQTVGTSGSNSFRPVPDEPRVVTGVAQDELDNSLGQLTSPVSTSSMPSASSDGHETTDLDADGQDSAGDRPQLPSERSETIGSDCVEAFPTVTSDLVSRRDAENQRRNTDDIDSSNVDVGRHGSSREYYGTINVREREGSHDHSTENRRYRDDRDTRHYDREEHMYDHDQDKSPRNRYPYNRDRGRYDDQEYGQHRNFDEQTRQGRRFKHMDDEDDDKEAYTSEGEQKRGKRDRERPPPDKAWYRDQEEYGRHYNRRHREASDSHARDYRDRERDQDRDRDKERDRDRYPDRRYPYDRDYRRHDDYYGHYEDYYAHRSRPSSRSGSRPEFDDDRRRDYSNYGGYYYQPRAMYEEYNYRYYMAWQRYMQQQQQYQQQQQNPSHHMTSHNSSMPEDRGSVHSGRSSTHEELSRHTLERSTEHNVSVMEETTTSTTPQRLTPAKFSTAHIKGLFTGSGQFLKVLPHYPLDGQSATVEIHDMSHVLAPDSELTAFPGPLIKGVTHKKSLMNFCTRKIKFAENDPNMLERDSVVLLWRLLLLLLRQNGMVVGTDIAELLLSHSSSQDASNGSVNVPGSVISTQNVQVVSPAVESESTVGKKHSDDKTLSEEELANTFREYLLYGNTHEALEWAMKYGLWGHALFLASKLGSRTYANVMTRFANGLTLNDPLQTLYQLMSGRLPAAVTCCADERWGDWKPHLAMILSNSSVQPELEHKAIITLGDTLASRGCLHAAHFCYLMAQLEFGSYDQKASKLVLIGSSHSKPFRIFANNEAIQMTEIYIYACQLADPRFDVPQFQIYKLLYAKRLVEAGMPKEALQYVEVIARTVTAQPSMYSVEFLQQIFDLGNRLKVHDVSYSPDTDGENEELPWLLHLHTVLEDYMAGAIQPDGPSFGSTSNLSLSEGESAHAHIPNNSLQQEHQQEQLHMELQQNFSQQTPLMQQQQQASQQQLLPSAQQQVELENQMNYGDHTQLSSEPGISNLPDSGVPYNIQAGWNSQEYQRRQNPGSEVRQDNDAYWPQNHWESGMALEGSTAAPQQQDYQHGPPSGWEFQSNTADTRDTGNTQDEQLPDSGFGYYPPQNKQSMERPSGEHHSSLVAHQSSHKAQNPAVGKPKSKKDSAKRAAPAPARSSWFGGLWNKLSLRPKNQMILPDDKEPKIVWNSDKQKWVNTDAEDEEDYGDLPPPPKMTEIPASTPHISSSMTSNGDVKMPPSSGQNMYKMNRSRGSRANYVDVFGGRKTSVQSAPAPAPAPEIFSNVASTQAKPPANFFVPAPVHSDDNTPVDFLTAAAEGVGGENSESAQLSYGAPLMFNPSDVSQFAAPQNSVSLSKKRYPN